MRAEHLYIHVPFCARRCVYCDFSIAVRPIVPVAEYLKGLEREWTRHRESTLDLSTVYFGGGTPSKLGADGVHRLMDMVRAHATVRTDAEITLETNPEDVSPATARAWREAGINRLSLGVQTFDDEALKWMHRTHDREGASRAIACLQDAGFEDLSIDLIFAVPASVGRSWERDIETTLSSAIQHVSVYGLTVEQQTPLGRWVAREDVAEAPEENFETEFLRAHDLFAGAGFEHYEVSNYALPGRHSRHNSAYWERRPYVGLGPSAHEFDGEERRWNADAYAHWLDRLAESADPVEGRECLSDDQRNQEQTYLSLRTNRGLDLGTETPPEIARWTEEGWAEWNDGVLRLTAPGWLRLDTLANSLTLLRSRF